MENESMNTVDPLSYGGVEEVRRHPASRAEMALVATIDALRAEIRAAQESAPRADQDHDAPRRSPAGVAFAPPAWVKDHLTFDDAAEYLAALAATLSASTTIPEIALPIEGMGRFFEVMSGACRDAMATVAAKDVPAEVWGRATGDGRTELACALMDFCEASGRAGAAGER